MINVFSVSPFEKYLVRLYPNLVEITLLIKECRVVQMVHVGLHGGKGIGPPSGKNGKMVEMGKTVKISNIFFSRFRRRKFTLFYMLKPS